MKEVILEATWAGAGKRSKPAGKRSKRAGKRSRPRPWCSQGRGRSCGTRQHTTTSCGHRRHCDSSRSALACAHLPCTRCAKRPPAHLNALPRDTRRYTSPHAQVAGIVEYLQRGRERCQLKLSAPRLGRCASASYRRLIPLATARPLNARVHIPCRKPPSRTANRFTLSLRRWPAAFLQHLLAMRARQRVCSSRLSRRAYRSSRSHSLRLSVARVSVFPSLPA